MVFLKVLFLLVIAFIMAEDTSAACDDALGLESGAITDSQISASSQFDNNHADSQGRLYYQETTSKAGAWAARTNDANQYLQIGLGGQKKVISVATQGRNYNGNWPPGSHNQWVTKYKLQYSNDGVNFQYYQQPGKTAEEVFTGNSDRDSVNTHVISPPIEASYIRFQPTEWHGHISMRVEVYGYQMACQNALGMESGAIADSRISVSSQYDNNHAAIQGRLKYQETTSKSGAWAALTNDVNQYLQIDLGNQKKVTGVATQGRNYNSDWPGGSHSQWVTKYKLQYSNDAVSFQYYHRPGKTSEEEFTGNADRDTTIYQELNPTFEARYVRFKPTAWHGHLSMRVELYGC